MRGIEMSSTARSTSSCSPRSTASAPSPASATTRRSGSPSSTRRRPRRTTAWSSASMIRVWRRRHAAGSSRVTRAPPSGLAPSLQRAADQHRALAHPAHAAALARRRAGSPCRRRRPPAAGGRRRARAGPRRACAAGVARDVRQRLLGDAVEDELGVAAERGRPGCTWTSTVELGVLGDALAQHEQRARQAEVVERLRAAAGARSGAPPRGCPRAVSCASSTPLAVGARARRGRRGRAAARRRSASGRRRRGAPARRAAARPPAPRARGRRCRAARPRAGRASR